MTRTRRMIHQLFPSDAIGRRWWAGLILFSLIFAFVDNTLESRRAAAQASEATFRSRAIRLAVSVTSLYQASRHQVEQTLNGGQPLTGVQTVYSTGSYTQEEKSLFPLNAMADAAIDGVPGRRNESFRTEITGRQLGPDYDGWTLRLRFLDDRLTFASYTSAERQPYNGPSNECLAIRMARRSIMVCGLIGWIGSMLTLVRHPRDRRLILQIAAACVLLTALALSLDCTPTDWLPWFCRRFGGLLVLMMGTATAALLVWPVRVRPASHARCGVCDYDLFGNQSGICPECGTAIPPHPTERWHAAASQIHSVSLHDPAVGDEIDWGPDQASPDPRPSPGKSHFAAPSTFRGIDADDDSKVRFRN